MRTRQWLLGAFTRALERTDDGSGRTLTGLSPDWAGLGTVLVEGQCLQGVKASSRPTSGTGFPVVTGCFAV